MLPKEIQSAVRSRHQDASVKTGMVLVVRRSSFMKDEITMLAASDDYKHGKHPVEDLHYNYNKKNTKLYFQHSKDEFWQ